MGIDSLRSEIEQNLEWLYEKNITYTKQVIDGSQIKDFVNTLMLEGKTNKLSLSLVNPQSVMFDDNIKRYFGVIPCQNQIGDRELQLLLIFRQ